ncbi:MAG: ABC transporter permease subunit [Actinobacteria bacterium]|nr:ABC transporter permease subunit [Actinomycetota bacterium]MSW98492.1 ABC transporter permease subunit [Actinomycetota bacterium]MSY82383.1 ABC transporter permease subunit [Actinomycetota bacterium]MSZ45474.1 ABC transporter permease subunit [Actinomycetota bacterium]MTA04532.1 ABC transporter permease subunit [Actinomycetota bacterium]
MPYLLLLPGMLWLIIFFLSPILTLVSTSTKVPGMGIGEFVQEYRWANYWDAITAMQTQFIRTFFYAIIATLLALAISYPLAYAIAFKSGRWKNVLLVLVVAPFFCSFILRTIAWRQILAQDGIVFKTLEFLHLISPDTRLTSSAFAVVTGLAYNFLPFMTLPLYASLERIDPRTMEASGDLYANGITTFRKVTLPLSMPGVVAGTLLTFIPAAGDFVNAQILGNPSTTMIGNVINAQYLQTTNYPLAATLSFILMIAILIIVLVYIRKSGTDELV